MPNFSGQTTNFPHFSPYVIPAAPGIFSPYASPRVSQASSNVVKAPAVVNAQSAVNTPNAAFKPIMYSANPVAEPAANPEPFLFGGGYGMNGGSFFDNNLNGKVKFHKFFFLRFFFLR